jgi:hypothetical protein
LILNFSYFSNTAIFTEFFNNEFKNEDIILKYDKTKVYNEHEKKKNLIDDCLEHVMKVVDENDLFETALINCNFLMARNIAKKTNMDPKYYLPLIEKFEKIGVGYENTILKNFKNTMMFLMVNIYFKKQKNIADFGFQVFNDFFEFFKKNPEVEDFAKENNNIINNNNNNNNNIEKLLKIAVDDVNTIKNIFIDVFAKNEDFFNIYFSTIQKIEFSIFSFLNKKNKNLAFFLNIIHDVFNSIKNSCAENYSKKTKYREAINVFLTCHPPNFLQAILSAKKNNDWKLTLLLAGF